MDPKIVIRSETDVDVDAITDGTVAAFKTLEISNHTEQFIIAALRAARDLSVSLVAEVDGRAIGHIAFSPVTISDGTRNWYGLGPVSVLPAYQRQGVGKALIREGLSRLKAMNAQGCCLVGHPDYYRKFGFTNMPGLVLEGVPQEVFFALSFDGKLRRAASLSMKDSKRMASKRVQPDRASSDTFFAWACPGSNGVRRNGIR
ncbi:MAG: N-acetyltransferase [Thiobacillus sp.]|nr:N-acetyltransferase [Thiobacillus sp.]MDP2979094.1 N-acetyltransferase [Thiobacillus sp.]